MQPVLLKKVSFSDPIEHVFEISRQPNVERHDRKTWKNSDNQLTPQVPKNVRAALDGRSVVVEMPTIRPQQDQQQEVKSSVLKKALTIGGLIVAIPGTIGCFSLMAVIGPPALAVGFGCAVIGALITAAGGKVR